MRATAAWMLVPLLVAACGDAGAPAGESVDVQYLDLQTSPPGAADADQDAEARAPGFELGSNPQGANTPSAFTALGEGDPLEIVYGPQGLWMVVVAFRTRGLVDGPLSLDAEIRTASRSLGALSLIGQPTFPGPEGWRYHYNFFLVVDDPTATGQVATLAFSVQDGEGRRIDEALEVTLTGGL